MRSRQHSFTKGKSCLPSLINFYDEMVGLVDEGRAADIVYLDFNKAFDTISHKTYWGLTTQKAALRKKTWGSWWTPS